MHRPMSSSAIWACLALIAVVGAASWFIPIVFLLAKAPDSRWKRFAGWSLAGWAAAVLAGGIVVCAASPMVSGGHPLVRDLSRELTTRTVLALSLVASVLFAALCGFLGGVYMRKGGLVIWRCGWRAIWKDRAEVARCVENTERRLAERRRKAGSHTWIWWLSAALLLGGGAVLGWFLLLV